MSPRHTDYYESSRALGVLYRSITLDDLHPIFAEEATPLATLSDPISLRLKQRIKQHFPAYSDPDGNSPEIRKLFGTYVEELRYICATHTLSNTPGVRLLEAEVVAGTILAKCSQRRWRKDRMYRMRLHASTLVRDIRRNIVEDLATASQGEIIRGLEIAWQAWDFSLRNKNVFGGQSFGLVALGLIFDFLEKLLPIPNGNAAPPDT